MEAVLDDLLREQAELRPEEPGRRETGNLAAIANQDFSSPSREESRRSLS